MRNVLVALLVALLAGLPATRSLAHAYAMPMRGTAHAPVSPAPAPPISAAHKAVAAHGPSAVRCCAGTTSTAHGSGAHCSLDLACLTRSAGGDAFVGAAHGYEEWRRALRADALGGAPFRPPIAS